MPNLSSAAGGNSMALLGPVDLLSSVVADCEWGRLISRKVGLGCPDPGPIKRAGFGGGIQKSKK